MPAAGWKIRTTSDIWWTVRSVTWARRSCALEAARLSGWISGTKKSKVTGARTVLPVPSLTTLDWMIIVRRCMGTKLVPMAPNFYVDITGLKSQASSSKHQAPRHKHQASSHKQQARGPRPLRKVSSTPNQGSGQV